MSSSFPEVSSYHSNYFTPFSKPLPGPIRHYYVVLVIIIIGHFVCQKLIINILVQPTTWHESTIDVFTRTFAQHYTSVTLTVVDSSVYGRAQ